MANKLNPFEEQIKKAVHDFEVPYDAHAWTRLEKGLDKSIGMSNPFYRNWFVGAAIVVIAVVGGYYFSIDNPEAAVIQPEIASQVEIPTESFPQEVEKSEGDLKVENDVVSTPESIKTSTPEVANSKSTSDEKKQLSADLPNEQANSSPKLDNEKPSMEVIVPPVTLNKTEVVKQDLFEKPFIKSNSTVICVGVELDVTLVNNLKEKVVWSLGNGENSTGQNVTVAYLEPGKYEISATGIESGLKSNNIEITVNQKPEATFSIAEKLENGSIPVVYFKAASIGEKNYQWTINDGTSSSGENFSHTFTKERDYEVVLRVSNKYGCIGSSHQQYTQETEFNLLAPNTFSPNGDGINDNWYPKALESGYFKFTLTIYDRNNQAVFTSSDPQNMWNGRVNGNQPNSGDFFIWKANVIDPNGIQQQYGGTILVIY